MRAIDLFAGGTYIHGLSYTPEYRAWQTMRLRCCNPDNAAYADYGGRGITVCDRWLDSPENFLADMGQKPSPKHELDRIDNDKGYSPGNCRWATRKVNDRNRRNNRHLEHDGVTRTLAEWSEITGINRDTLQKRLASGWSVDRAITTPTRGKAKNGHAKHLQRHPCVDCGKPVSRTRCKSCENVRRGKQRRIDAVCPPVARDIITAIKEAA
ncbi:hypothetical protein E5S69_20670 [Cupriavidus necator]|uniref:hypothetical protein n=1 Tax=Cupriavidus necator TaxID=106590 RepID=UPI00148F6896|nr:hypothetical protein [Cupriavidus necator]NOV25919.1 hypothetical protein [Cupriavidus necator]